MLFDALSSRLPQGKPSAHFSVVLPEGLSALTRFTDGFVRVFCISFRVCGLHKNTALNILTAAG